MKTPTAELTKAQKTMLDTLNMFCEFVDKTTINTIYLSRMQNITWKQLQQKAKDFPGMGYAKLIDGDTFRERKVIPIEPTRKFFRGKDTQDFIGE